VDLDLTFQELAPLTRRAVVRRAHRVPTARAPRPGPGGLGRGVPKRSLAIGALLAASLAALPLERTLAEDRTIPEPLSAPAGTAAAAPSAEGEMGEEIVVTPTRGPQKLRDVPAAVTVVNRAAIERSATKTVDELLQAVPSFDTFRRSSSIGSDPSSEGMSLRGVGPSATSRSLVLVDGVPANDPFGDWVYWRSMPPLGIQRIEVAPGGGSAVYGNYALGGVLQVLSRPITPTTLDALADYGSYDTARASLWASDRWGPLGAAVEGDYLTSEGYEVVAPYDRGPIDAATPTQHAVASGRLEWAPSKDLAVQLRGGYFYENQNGGTEFTTSMVRQGAYSGSVRYSPGEAGTFDLAVFGHAGGFVQNRARVTSGRTEEFLSAHQEVPTRDVGAGLLWTSRPLFSAQAGSASATDRMALPPVGSHTLTAGLDARWITGQTDETEYPAVVTPTSVVQQNSGGKQELFGVFLQDVYEVTEAVEAVAALRYDYWANTSAFLDQGLASGTSNPTFQYPDRSDQAFDPKAGVRVRPLEWLTVRAAGYGAFRAPTLNELYRSFQVGTVKTFGNANLGPERIWGAEAGVDIAIPGGLTLRATGFWNALENPIVNVTCSAAPGIPVGTPGVVCIGPDAQKQNLGQANIPGLEASLDWRIAPHWSVGGAYTFAYSQVVSAPGNPQLVGKHLPQDPTQRASLQAAFDDSRLVTVSVQLDYLGLEYEDAQNTLPMGQALIVDLFAAWHALPVLDVYAAVENLFNTQYLVGRAGVDTIGQPLFVHGGVRVHLGE